MLFCGFGGIDIGCSGVGWRGSLAGQPGGSACTGAYIDVGCIDCRIDAGRCDVCIDVACMVCLYRCLLY